jgi:guanylate kinase
MTATTRKPRNNELNGVHYFFMNKEEFRQKIDEDFFIEHAEYNGNYYGTPKYLIEELLNDGKNVLIILDVQGAMQVQQIYHDEAVLIFVNTPTLLDLFDRLQKRGESEEEINKRISIAKTEIKYQSQYNFTIINQFLDVAVEDLITIIEELIKRNLSE